MSSSADRPPTYSLDDPTTRPRYPPLPPCASISSTTQTNDDALRPSMVSSSNSYPSNEYLVRPDPRSISQESLHPPTSSAIYGRRTLLLIYIHGFMGNETSFQSFPAHLHNLLTVTIDSSQYLVHTKVYPKFKTRHPIHVATEQFSNWMSRFETPNMDIVLLGHSMGGLLASEVILLTCEDGTRKHQGILGQIAFDTPFLGMHPGVITAGIASLFRPAPPPVPEDPATADEFFGKRPQRNFTVVAPKKEGTWDSRLRFLSKYHGHLTQATAKYLTSHLEFGACLADPISLKNRYRRIRDLEDGVGGDRVRFANYYTVSFGREKGAELPGPAPPAVEIVGQGGLSSAPQSADGTRLSASSSRHSIDGARLPTSTISPPYCTEGEYLTVDPSPPQAPAISNSSQASLTLHPETPSPSPTTPEIALTTAPEKPLEPMLAPADSISDPAERKKTEKDNKALMKGFAKDVKAWTKGEKHRAKEQQRQQIEDAQQQTKKKRERKFCITPHSEDHTWTKVTAEGVDEVGAHCGLFFVGEVYGRLVGDVADRIEEWTRGDRDRRYFES